MASNAEIKLKIVEHSKALGRPAPDVEEATSKELTAVAKALKAEVAELTGDKPKIVLPDNTKAKSRAPGHYVSKGCSITAPGKRVLGDGEPVTELF